MCVIISALRKKHLARTDVVHAMKHNSHGFFMSHWSPQSSSSDERQSIRTMKEDDALKFFDDAPDDDVFVMHARIKSKGDVNVDNVHGWEEDGVSFCHNMTMTSLSPLMEAENWKGTDSEYFFRKLFMPMYRGEHLADPDLPPGEMGPATKRLTALLCGDSNKFLFVMPDNSVIRAGKWSTLESETRTVLEEREVDETVGEKVDIDGKVTKKTRKVKKEIEVEHEFATVVASNTYFRPSPSYSTSYYGGRRWNQETKSWEPADGSKPAPTTGCSGASGLTDYDPDDPYGENLPLSYYGDDFSDFCHGHKRGNKSDKADKADKAEKTPKVKKSDIEDDDMKNFLAWRKLTPDFVAPEVITPSDAASSLLFGSVKFENGRLTGDSMAKLFNVLLRCIVYDNYRTNIEHILATDTVLGVSDEFGLVAQESESMVDDIIPPAFDSTTCAFASNVVRNLCDKMAVTPGMRAFTLPSEAVGEAFLEVVREMDYGVGASMAVCEDAVDAVATDACAKRFFASMAATDIRLNLSFDHTVKSNKDIERYVRAAIVAGRKIRWVHPALLLSSDASMVSDTGGWSGTDAQKALVDTLSFLAEACVTGGQSLDAADRKYLADLKNAGYAFDRAETDGAEASETFVPGEVAEATAGSNAGSDDGMAILDGTAQGEAECAEAPVSSDPEKAEQSEPSGEKK